jgi:hypothetical protein
MTVTYVLLSNKIIGGNILKLQTCIILKYSTTCLTNL